MDPWTERTILTTDSRAPRPDIKELVHEYLFVLIVGNFVKCTEGNTNTEKGQKTSWGSPLVNKSPTLSSTYQIIIWEGCKKKKAPIIYTLTSLLFKIRIQKVFPLLQWGMYWVPSFPSYITYLYPKPPMLVRLPGYRSSNNVTEKQHTSVTSTQASLWGRHSAVGPGGWQHKTNFS